VPQGTNHSHQPTDVVVGVYHDLDAARADNAAVAEATRSGTVIDGVALVVKDVTGETSVEETGDHLVAEGAIAVGGIGLVLGLFAPPLLLATAVGAMVGAVAGQVARGWARSDIEHQAEATIPAGGAGLVVACPRGSSEAVLECLSRADRTAVGEADGTKAHALRTALADAERQLGEPGEPGS
jgi:uncharacterized membrane protein